MPQDKLDERDVRWLEQNDTPEVQEWLREQAAFTDRYLRGLPVRERIREQLTKMFSLQTVGLPIPCGGRYFMARRPPDEDMSIVYVQDSLDEEPRVLLNPADFSEDHTVTLSGWHVSGDGRFMAFGRSAAGNDRRSLHVLDVDTGKELPDEIPAEYYPAFCSWDASGRGFLYTRRDHRMPDDNPKLYKRLFHHRLGDDCLEDELVFGAERDKNDIISGWTTKDCRYLVVSVYSQNNDTDLEQTEQFVRDLRKPDSEFVQIVHPVPGTRCWASYYNGTFYYQTNRDAPNERILALDAEAALAGAEPHEIIPEGNGVIRGKILTDGRLYLNFSENVHSMLREYDLNGRFVREIEFPAPGSTLGTGYKTDGDEMFFGFWSFAMPFTVLRLDMESGTFSVHTAAEAGIDTSKIQTEQVWYESKDGTRVPMFLIYQKGLPRDGDRPTVLYGYGGFNISLTPAFDKSIIPFLSRGGVYAIANLRGGNEFGEKWHKAGTKFNKQNVFDDFAAAAEWLKTNGFTCTERLAISGDSNGGLLTMATITQNPGLCGAAIARVPVTDMLRYHLFNGGVYWIPDYGDPEDPKMRKYLLDYSPVHNVRAGERYPAVLLATSDQDDRVHPSHAYKMFALLCEADPDNDSLFLRVEPKAGHAGASAISKYIETQADLWAFIFDQLGVE